MSYWALADFSWTTEVNRYTLYTGFDYMVSPARNLTERGFDVDFGVTLKPWVAVGGDFGALGDGIFSGAGTINGNETVFAPLLTAAQPLGAPPPNAVNVSFKSRTYTFAAGPQFYLRKFKPITFFARPGLEGIHEQAIIGLPPQLAGLLTMLGGTAPLPNQSDTKLFFGAGGGFDINLAPVGLRFTVDWVDTHLFSNLLSGRQNYARFTVGPVFKWGQLR